MNYINLVENKTHWFCIIFYILDQNLNNFLP